ncbi:sulfatase-like hydrolase/transferase [Gracilibacillus salitolerans]|uniref:Sulfatase-like hydrolase/transferase n=1 Tax=Gracilibacillus salitolerans TaxID=2663022 RepID=A0A5Q2TI00_9BACI|nr:sulfatase [Gracilibacillus salitolerans]QGH33583.1 sulfatase-like hydrolase/transferase [Gracilibacillus salitolerans]
MKILYIDIDSLRPDHLGVYGYHRNTSPNIDRIAKKGVTFTNYYASDAPCAPSRNAMFSSRFGIHTGSINHGGLDADVRPIGADRPFNHHHTPYQAWVEDLRFKGHHTAMISPFPGRHAKWNVLEGFLEMHDTGKHAGETAGDVAKEALKWIKGRGTEKEDWFLYLNFWDPHTPYRTPAEYGNPFEHSPAADWLTDDIIAKQRESFGPMSARELPARNQWPNLPEEISCREDFKRWIDGYDTAIRHVDDHVGQLLQALEEEGILEETTIIISADHGENQGELNIYGDHQTADHITSRVPLIMAGPDIKHGHIDEEFHYQIDLGPTLVELVGAEPRERWDGTSFLPTITKGEAAGRDYLVVSQAAWSCQRGVLYDNWMLIRTYHDGLKDFPDLMLFDIENDPHETTNLVEKKPEVVAKGLRLLDEWVAEQMITSDSPTDPMWNVIQEGGPFHTRGNFNNYVKKLRNEGREDAAEILAKRHQKFQKIYKKRN